jgi:hypothetical protein
MTSDDGSLSVPGGTGDLPVLDLGRSSAMAQETLPKADADLAARI